MFSRGNATSGRADLQRHDRVREAGEQWGREQQQHDRAVHGEELVVGLIRQELHPGEGELGAHRQRQHTAEHEEAHRRDEVQVADHLVIGGGHPPPHHLAVGAGSWRGRHRLGGAFHYSHRSPRPFVTGHPRQEARHRVGVPHRSAAAQARSRNRTSPTGMLTRSTVINSP